MEDSVYHLFSDQRQRYAQIMPLTQDTGMRRGGLCVQNSKSLWAVLLKRTCQVGQDGELPAHRF